MTVPKLDHWTKHTGKFGALFEEDTEERFTHPWRHNDIKSIPVDTAFLQVRIWNTKHRYNKSSNYPVYWSLLSETILDGGS